MINHLRECASIVYQLWLANTTRCCKLKDQVSFSDCLDWWLITWLLQRNERFALTIV